MIKKPYSRWNTIAKLLRFLVAERGHRRFSDLFAAPESDTHSVGRAEIPARLGEEILRLSDRHMPSGRLGWRAVAARAAILKNHAAHMAAVGLFRWRRGWGLHHPLLSQQHVVHHHLLHAQILVRHVLTLPLLLRRET